VPAASAGRTSGTRFVGPATPSTLTRVARAQQTFDMPRMYALLIVLFVLAIGANALIGRLGLPCAPFQRS